jgi:hypothetical protein
MTRTAVLGVLLATLVSLPQSLLIAQEPQLGRVWPLDQLVTAPDLDSEVAAVFENAYGFNPLTEDQLRDIRWRETTVRSLGGFSSTVKAGKLAVQDPTNAAYEQEFARRLNTLLASTEGQNIMATLFFVFRESIVEQNEDKKYWLTKLKEMNEIAEALADQLKYLNDRLSQLEEKKRSKQYDTDDEEYDPGPEKVLVDLKVLALEADDRGVIAGCDSIPCVTARAQLLNKDEINALVSTIEADRETVRNKRQMIATQFENANKIGGQYINMLASVLKTTKETNKGTIRNLR